jgi:CheY-like chemotaxis protein
MKLLIVEDDEDNVAFFQAELNKTPAIRTTFARSRDGALALIETETFELIILDLKIPTTDGNLDSDYLHGLAVHSFVRERARGTPVFIFSAYGTLGLVSELLEKNEHHDIWGSGESQAMTLFKEKSDLGECLAFIQRTERQLSALSDIEISSGAESLDLDQNQKKVLRIFARLNRGSNVKVNRLGGGLSPAQTFRIDVRDQYGATTSYAAAKLGLLADLEKEYERYERYVSPVLPVGGFAHVIKFTKAGAANMGGLFYGLAKEYNWTLFDTS